MKVSVVHFGDDEQVISQNCECIKIFLAGGCTTTWRDDVVKWLSKYYSRISFPNDNIELRIYTPVVSDIMPVNIEELITWEHNRILESDVLVMNFEGGSNTTAQPESLYELGRFTDHVNMVVVNVSDLYSKSLEVMAHLKLLNHDFQDEHDADETSHHMLVIKNKSSYELASKTVERIDSLIRGYLELCTARSI